MYTHLHKECWTRSSINNLYEDLYCHLAHLLLNRNSVFKKRTITRVFF